MTVRRAGRYGLPVTAALATAALGTTSTMLAAAQTIDMPPAPTTRSVVINMEDVRVAGQSRCGMDVRYRGKVDQPITFVGAGCRALRVVWVTPATLGRARLAALAPDVQRDLRRAPGGRTLLVTGITPQGRELAQLFPINVADRVYRVSLPR